ncbi:MAG: DUF1295 domain-containing protein [Minisyncoccia bacterium]
MIETILQSPLIFSGVLMFVYASLAFLLALHLKNNSIMDVAYGLGFVLVAVTTLRVFGFYPLGTILTSLVFIWGLRLSVRIYRRNHGKPEDFRYATWRKSWKWFTTRSFFQIFMLQGAIILGIVSPVVIANSSSAYPQFWYFSVLGIIIWFIGFFFEAVGDYQLDHFLHNPVNKGHLMVSGLWSITRHPNYFGEATMWWGIWIAALPAVLTYGFFAVIVTFLISPALITFLLLKVSGVPMLEKAMEGRPGWAEYKAKTSVFVPFL